MVNVQRLGPPHYAGDSNGNTEYFAFFRPRSLHASHLSELVLASDGFLTQSYANIMQCTLH